MIITISLIVMVVILVGIITSNKDNVTYAVGDTLASVVINQSKGTTWSSGASGVYNTIYTKENSTTIGSDYRYIGANVKNYVKFNNDMYQIIGVFDENTHGESGQQLVKLIRARILGDFSWGVYNSSATSGTYSSYQNDWTGKQNATAANLNILLNQYFLNKTDISTIYGSCSDWTYFNSDNNYKTKDCQTLVGYGIDASIRDYIETTTWHLNGCIGNGLTSNNFYLCERGMYTGCTSANSGGGDTATSAKIGLMYVSDYTYASGYNANTTTLESNTPYKGIQNWMFKGDEWTITPKSSSDTNVFAVLNAVSSPASFYGLGIRPTFYLKEDVYVTGGTGSFDNPYTISCDTCTE